MMVIHVSGIILIHQVQDVPHYILHHDYGTENSSLVTAQIVICLYHDNSL